LNRSIQESGFSRSPPSQSLVRVSKLSKKEHGAILCYPGTDLRTFTERVRQLKKLEVTNLVLEGESKIGKHGVLGKGCVSVVVRARKKNDPSIYALKIRRTDANRPSMKKDYELQKLANSFSVGPKVVSATNDLFLMEYVDAIKIGKWFAKLRTRTSKRYVRKLVRTILYQCFLLDMHSLDHGELSNPSKHILIRKQAEPEVVIIDYESASTDRRTSNLTSVAQFLFLNGTKIRRILGIQESENITRNSRLVKLLRGYKEDRTRESFEKILAYIKC
jgi:putative serine/threonine protein kinase